MADPDSGDRAWLKHLEFIQAVITRLANDSFLMKGWALTVAGAFYGFAVKGTNWKLAAIGLMPVLVFWGLDAYFLRQERLFRRLYNQVRERNPRIEPFAMNAAAHAPGVASGPHPDLADLGAVLRPCVPHRRPAYCDPALIAAYAAAMPLGQGS